VERRTVSDVPARALVEAANGAALLVVGARGRGGFRGLLLGSVSQQCLHHAHCPVAVIRTSVPAHADRVDRILVGIDGTASRDALCWAVDEAVVRHGSVTAISAWHVPYHSVDPFAMPLFDPEAFEGFARVEMDDVIDSVDASQLSRPIERVVVSGGAAATILEAAQTADMVVLGSRGRGGFGALLLGSVGQQVAQHASCPVVIVPPPDRAS
jgi:nucleotide-binding universal stress UspA family protein